MKKRVEDFRDRLKPFDDIYMEMYAEIRKRLEAMTESELKQTMLDALQPSPINCGWTTYGVASIVREVGQWVSPQAIKATEQPSSEATAAEGELN